MDFFLSAAINVCALSIDSIAITGADSASGAVTVAAAINGAAVLVPSLHAFRCLLGRISAILFFPSCLPAYPLTHGKKTPEEEVGIGLR